MGLAVREICIRSKSRPSYALVHMGASTFVLERVLVQFGWTRTCAFIAYDDGKMLLVVSCCCRRTWCAKHSSAYYLHGREFGGKSIQIKFPPANLEVGKRKFKSVQFRSSRRETRLNWFHCRIKRGENGVRTDHTSISELQTWSFWVHEKCGLRTNCY